MTQLQAGTYTFLFSDLEGSTNLVRNYPDAWPKIEARHLDILRGAITGHRGVIFQHIGDEIDGAFQTPMDALAAALQIQRALRDEDWGEIGSIRVRMGLHTGPAAPRDGKFDGYLTLSHAKRIMSVASGDQILVSEATESMLREGLPQEVSLQSLGEHRLKDFERPEAIFQVTVPDLPDAFPPIKSLDRSPHRLPEQLTSFVGRSKELGEVKALLSSERLLTLTGPGGSGKTRLALQAAVEMAGQFSDGAFFVALTSINDPGLVPSTIAQTLGLREMPGRSIPESLKDYLRGKSLLLLLDNFEQVIEAAPLVTALLMACSDLKILVTSREALRISGEREYPVPPLALPDLSRLPSLDSLTQYAAVELFVQRAKAVKPDFQITMETAPAVAEICHRLDGLPLAIELAAARIKLLPPRAMLARLGRRLEFLTGGARDLPERQQTLRSAIAWSYDLLNAYEQELFRRLSVFVGGCTLDAVEAVVENPPDECPVLDCLSSLTDKSLLRTVETENGEARFIMLETLREFGLEQLAAQGEQETIHHRHARFFLALAEQAESRLERDGQVQWIQQIEQEHDNLRAALEWCMASAGPSTDGAEMCLRLAGSLGLFWEARGYFSEGRERLGAILSKEYTQAQTALRGRLLARAAELAYRQSDFLATSGLAGASLAIYREVGDRRGIASMLIKLGNAATEMGDFSAAVGYIEEALATWRELGDRHGIARALISFGWTALRAGDYPPAQARLTEALALSRALGDTRNIGFELAGLGEVAMRQGDYARANQLVEESLELRRQLGNKWGVGVSLGILGWIAMHEEDWERAVGRLGESLEIRQEIGDQSGIAWCLERLAEVAQARGQAEKAVRLLGAGAALREPIRSALDPVDQPAYEQRVRSLREAIGEDQYAVLWDQGRAMSQTQAAGYALEDPGKAGGLIP